MVPPNNLPMSNNLRLTFFGTSAGFPTAVRHHTTTIGLWRGGNHPTPSEVEGTGDALYLFDCGDGAAGQFACLGIPPDAVRALFITHLHADHVGGLAALLQWMQLNRRTAPLTIYAPAHSIPGLQDYLRLVYLFPMDRFPLEFRPVSTGTVHQETGLEVAALHSHHLEGSEAFSYLVSADSKTIYFSGDLGGPEEAAKQADGVEVAVVELAHFTAEELGAALSASGLLRLIITHINDDFEPFEDEIPQRLRSMGFEGEIIIATDGLEVDL
ncbi:MAG: MBL fold metallo-hydrolase [Armatimonadota bacterium]